MALSDILEALALGGAGAIRGYQSAKEEERARQERERDRMQRALERSEDIRRAQEAADRLFGFQVQQAVGRGELVPTEYVSYAKPSEFLSGERVGMQRRDDAVSNALFDAEEAPGQTYAARVTQEPDSALNRALSIEPEDVARQFKREPVEGSWTEGRGTLEFGGQSYRPTTPAERLRKEMEIKEAEYKSNQELLSAALSGDQDAISRVYAKGLGKEFEGLVAYNQPAAEDLPDPLQIFNTLREEFGDEVAARLAFRQEMYPTPEPEELPKLPTSVAEKVAINQSIIDTIEIAQALIETDAARGLGWVQNIWGVQRFGTEDERRLRALVSDVGSLLANARSGAAISAQEYERMRGFLPDVGEGPEGNRVKLARVAESLRNANARYYDQFTPGYNPYRAQMSSAPSVNALTPEELSDLDYDIVDDVYGSPNNNQFKSYSDSIFTGPR